MKARSALSPCETDSVSELPGARSSLTAVCVVPFDTLLITRSTRYAFAAGLLPDASSISGSRLAAVIDHSPTAYGSAMRAAFPPLFADAQTPLGRL